MKRLIGAHLVGSIPFGDSQNVFKRVSSILGGHLKCIPDGETGERINWILFQVPLLLKHGAFELDRPFPFLTGKMHILFCELMEKAWFRNFASIFEPRSDEGHLENILPRIRFKENIDRSSVMIDTLYDEFAISSYKIFGELKAEGIIPPNVRFQVSLPTPYSSMLMFIHPDDFADYFKAYDKGLMRALANILRAIPHDDLAIQWDICQEVLAYEGYFKDNREKIFQEEIMHMLGRYGDQVSHDVLLGYHLCYGSPPPSSRHIMEPKDGTILTLMSNQIAKSVKRHVDWIHVPVPIARTDDDYYKPFENLQIDPETDFYLGLIHHNDAVGNQKRIDAASKVLKRFGVASECGFGRTPERKVEEILLGHRDVLLHK